MTRVPMTNRGAEKLRQELDQLKTVERPKVIQAIAEARAHGDLKENAEYHAARESQGFIEGRIMEIEAKLSNAQIIDVTRMENTGRVIFGATVTLIKEDNNQTVVYTIVGEDEADLSEGKISVTSPISRSMVGKYVGDVIEVKTAENVSTYEITKVDYI
ncbi:MAG TPA: transcription elongation factor GreA [Gammaproteobacteria bacterium]|nr:transcription elongation factor GreA [Gammaproteobacteria bacterium]